MRILKKNSSYYYERELSEVKGLMEREYYHERLEG